MPGGIKTSKWTYFGIRKKVFIWERGEFFMSVKKLEGLFLAADVKIIYHETPKLF